MRFAIPVLTMSVLLASANAQTPMQYWPDAQYDASVPSVDRVLGHGVGDRIFSHAEIMKYMKALAEAAPNRVRLVNYAQTWEGREVVVAVIGSKANLARLDTIQSSIASVSDPRITKQKEARKLITSLPTTVWLGYSIHGNEISGANAALLTAYHLLAAQGDPLVDNAMNDAIIFIDPLQNPDGRDRFVRHFYENLGLIADEHPLSAEHNESWPAGRTNHYLFDLNRDWFALTQPESRGRIRAMQRWLPLVVADLHEMGHNSTYYFPPPALPHNPHLVKAQKDHLEGVGRNNAKWFDRFGIDYFTREVYDAFYPGYGDSQPAYYGAVAMTYEQASARGLVMRRTAGDDLYFRDGVRNHFVASLGTIEYATDNREKLWEDFYNYRRTAIEEGGRGKIQTYILPNRGDTSAVRKLVGVLMEQGIDVEVANKSFRACGEAIPERSYIISLAQPEKRLIRTLLDPVVPLDKDFVAEQERRRARNLPDEIYDITAWSLPLAFNVDLITCGSSVRADSSAVAKTDLMRGSITDEDAKVAYLVPWGNAASGRLLAASLREGLHVLSADKAFSQAGREYAAGSLIFKVDQNPAELGAVLRRLAIASGAEVVAADTSWVDDGPNFGSGNVAHIPAPKIGLVWDTPTSSNNAGATRFVLEQQFGYPVTPIPARLMRNADLTNFNVIILPKTGGGSYAAAFGASGATRLKDWVADGGVLIPIGNAINYLIDPEVALLDVLQEERVLLDEEGKAAEPTELPEPEKGEIKANGRLFESAVEFREAIQAEDVLPDSLPGALLKANVDQEHWLGAGVPETVNVMVQGRNIYAPITIDKGINVAYYPGADELLASGYLWEENRKQLAYKPFMLVQPKGRGLVIAFTADPNFRGYMDGLNTLFLNAVFRAPGHARRLVPAGGGLH